jgi:hypothetical protein
MACKRRWTRFQARGRYTSPKWACGLHHFPRKFLNALAGPTALGDARDIIRAFRPALGRFPPATEIADLDARLVGMAVLLRVPGSCRSKVYLF